MKGVSIACFFTAIFCKIWTHDLLLQPEINKRYRHHLPAPKLPLPGHAESYNPPPEYLFTEEEVRMAIIYLPDNVHGLSFCARTLRTRNLNFTLFYYHPTLWNCMLYPLCMYVNTYAKGTFTYPHKPGDCHVQSPGWQLMLRVAWCQSGDMQGEKRVWSYMVPNVRSETGCH